jgi:hypothetical protein
MPPRQTVREQLAAKREEARPRVGKGVTSELDEVRNVDSEITRAVKNGELSVVDLRDVVCYGISLQPAINTP